MPFANRRFVRAPALFESIVSVDPKKLLIITSAFNDVSLVDMQNRALKKFVQDPYDYFVVDNSTKEDESEKIKAYCIEHKINYARMPFNIGNQRAVVTMYGLASAVIRVLKSSSKIEFTQQNYADVELRIPSVGKAEQLLGFTAKVDLDEGIGLTAEHYRNND